jgi:hypothetical protein
MRVRDDCGWGAEDWGYRAMRERGEWVQDKTLSLET